MTLKEAISLKKNSKYNNQKVVIDGIEFASKHEGYRYIELKYLERAGIISDLRLQVPFELIPTLRDEATGKVLEKRMKYIADFTYMQNGKMIVEDAKGCRTDVFKIKKKLMLYKFNIQIKEV